MFAKLLKYWPEYLLAAVLMVYGLNVGYQAAIGSVNLLSFFGAILWAMGFALRWMQNSAMKTWNPPPTAEQMYVIDMCRYALRFAGVLIALVDIFVW